MSPSVKPKRRYFSRRRDSQAEETRIAILDAAHRLFTRNGWAAATIVLIAGEAGVAPETVYARFGNKRSILQALVQRALRGPEQDTPLMEQPRRLAVRAVAGMSDRLDAFSHDISGILARVAPILGVVRSAAETDPDMQALYRDLHAARRRNLGVLIADIASAGALRPDLDADAATECVWSLASPELYLLVTGVGDKSHEDYAAWLADTLKRMLLAEG